MIVDASVWVSYFIVEDTRHVETVAWLDDMLHSGRPMAVATLVLPEVAGAVARRSSRPDLGLRAAHQLLEYPFLDLVYPDRAITLLATRVAATLPMKGADAIYVAVAKTLERSLVTWDVEQRTRGGGLLVSARPPEENAFVEEFRKGYISPLDRKLKRPRRG